MANTRKMLERMPDNRLDWRPHGKSWNMGELATHVAFIPGWTVDTMEKDRPSGQVRPERRAAARAAIAGFAALLRDESRNPPPAAVLISFAGVRAEARRRPKSAPQLR